MGGGSEPVVSRLPEALQGYLKALLEGLRRLDPEVEVYLTGSYARGDWLEDSDVDLIVVSRLFEGLELGERYRMVKEAAPSGFGLEALTYTPEEFERAKVRSVILQDMLEYAVRLA